MKTKGQVEDAIATALSQFEREYLGRGPKEARVFLVQDMVLASLTGILSPAEQQLSNEPDGITLIKQLRSRLIESSETALKQLVEEATEATVISLHTDISSRTGERIFVFKLDCNLEEAFSGGK